MTILLLLVGLGLIVLGADWLVDGASAIARKAGVSEFVIGLTIVGFGTSCPELVVSLTGAIQGNADISAGRCSVPNRRNNLPVRICGISVLLLQIRLERAIRTGRTEVCKNAYGNPAGCTWAWQHPRVERVQHTSDSWMLIGDYTVVFLRNESGGCRDADSQFRSAAPVGVHRQEMPH